MSSVTLLESGKLTQDDLVIGVVEDIITVNQMFLVMPFDGIEGSALAYNRENALGGVGVTGVGTVIGTGDTNPLTGGTGEAKDPATFTQITSALTTILGDAEVNGMIQHTRSDKNDQTGTQISSKAKHIGRVYQHMLVNGTGAANQFDGLINLATTSQTVVTATNGEVQTFELLDEVADLVTSKDGVVDWYTMHKRERRKYRANLRALGGASIIETVELPGGQRIMSYSETPIFRNDYIPIDQVQGTETAATTIFAGCWDDGSRSVGLAGLTAEKMAGINVVDVGEKETADEHIWRARWYCGLALFSQRALAALPGIAPA